MAIAAWGAFGQGPYVDGWIRAISGYAGRKLHGEIDWLSVVTEVLIEFYLTTCCKESEVSGVGVQVSAIKKFVISGLSWIRPSEIFIFNLYGKIAKYSYNNSGR